MKTRFNLLLISALLMTAAFTWKVSSGPNYDNACQCNACGCTPIVDPVLGDPPSRPSKPSKPSKPADPKYPKKPKVKVPKKPKVPKNPKVPKTPTKPKAPKIKMPKIKVPKPPKVPTPPKAPKHPKKPKHPKIHIPRPPKVPLPPKKPKDPKKPKVPIFKNPSKGCPCCAGYGNIWVEYVRSSVNHYFNIIKKSWTGNAKKGVYRVAGFSPCCCQSTCGHSCGGVGMCGGGCGCNFGW